MTYQQHEELFLHYDARIQNKDYKSQQEKQILQLHAFTHEVLAAKRLPDSILQNAGLYPRQLPFFPQFPEN
jgi:hypothetical protein